MLPQLSMQDHNSAEFYILNRLPRAVSKQIFVAYKDRDFPAALDIFLKHLNQLNMAGFFLLSWKPKQEYFRPNASSDKASCFTTEGHPGATSAWKADKRRHTVPQHPNNKTRECLMMATRFKLQSSGFCSDKTNPRSIQKITAESETPNSVYQGRIKGKGLSLMAPTGSVGRVHVWKL